MRKSSVVRAAAIVAAPFVVASSQAEAAVIVESIYQTVRVRVEAIDANGTTVVERVTENTIVGPVEASPFARLPYNGDFEYSYAAATMRLNFGGPVIVEADNQLVVEHFFETVPGRTAISYAEVVTVIDIVHTGGRQFTVTGTMGGGGSPDHSASATLGVDFYRLGDDDELLPTTGDENGWLPGRYRAEFFSSAVVEPAADQYWTGASLRSRHYLAYIPTPGTLLTIAAFGAFIPRRRR